MSSPWICSACSNSSPLKTWGCISCGRPYHFEPSFSSLLSASSEAHSQEDSPPFTVLKKEPKINGSLNHQRKDPISVLCDGGMRFEGLLHSEDEVQLTLCQVKSFGTEDRSSSVSVPSSSFTLPFISFTLKEVEIHSAKRLKSTSKSLPKKTSFAQSSSPFSPKSVEGINSTPFCPWGSTPSPKSINKRLFVPKTEETDIKAAIDANKEKFRVICEKIDTFKGACAEDRQCLMEEKEKLRKHQMELLNLLFETTPKPTPASCGDSGGVNFTSGNKQEDEPKMKGAVPGETKASISQSRAKSIRPVQSPGVGEVSKKDETGKDACKSSKSMSSSMRSLDGAAKKDKAGESVSQSNESPLKPASNKVKARKGACESNESPLKPVDSSDGTAMKAKAGKGACKSNESPLKPVDSSDGAAMKANAGKGTCQIEEDRRMREMKREEARKAKEKKEEQKQKARAEKKKLEEAKNNELLVSKARECQEKGIDMLGEWDMHAAVKHFSEAIRNWPTASSYEEEMIESYVCRSECFFHLGRMRYLPYADSIQFQKFCVKDCNEVLKHNPENGGVLLRRMEAKYSLQDWHGVCSDGLSIKHALDAKVFTFSDRSMISLVDMLKQARENIQTAKLESERKAREKMKANPANKLQHQKKLANESSVNCDTSQEGGRDSGASSPRQSTPQSSLEDQERKADKKRRKREKEKQKKQLKKKANAATATTIARKDKGAESVDLDVPSISDEATPAQSDQQEETAEDIACRELSEIKEKETEAGERSQLKDQETEETPPESEVVAVSESDVIPPGSEKPTLSKQEKERIRKRYQKEKRLAKAALKAKQMEDEEQELDVVGSNLERNHQKQEEGDEDNSTSTGMSLDSNADGAQKTKRLGIEVMCKEVVEDYCQSSIRPKDLRQLIASRDPEVYAKFEEEVAGDEEEEEEEEASNNFETESSTQGVKDSENLHETTTCMPVVLKDSSEDHYDLNSELDMKIYLAKFDSIFEKSLWEIEITEGVVRWFRKKQTKNMKLCRNVIQRLLTLANGYWNERNHKTLAGTTHVDLYEANLSSGQRIIYEIAVNLSERLNSFAGRAAASPNTSMVPSSASYFSSSSSSCDSSSAAIGSIHAEMIRVWAIVEDHDNLSREIENVEKCHQRGRGCLVQSQLIPTAKPLNRSIQKIKDKDGVEQRIPKTFSAMSEEETIRPAFETDSESQVKSTTDKHYHLGSSNPNEYNLLKFYSFNSHMLGCLFGGNNKTDSSLPFKMTSKEYAIARLNPAKPCGILLMGRSGTGKTSVQCYRLAFDWVDYWSKVVENEPFLQAGPTTAINVAKKINHFEKKDGGNDEDVSCDMTNASAGENEKEENVVSFCHLRQVFVTKSMCLRTEVQRVSRDLMRGSHVDGPISNVNGIDQLDSLATVPSDRYPLFTTLSEFLLLLDKTLDGGHFVSKLSNTSKSSTTELSGLDAYYDEEDEDDMDDMNGSDDVENNGFLSSSELQNEKVAQQEMGWMQFLTKVWPKLSKKDTDGVDASLLWTEINSSLKGSVSALKVLAEYDGASSLLNDRLHALKEQYDAGGKKQSAIPKEQREQMWKLFVQYEKIRMKLHYFDQNDLVANLFRRLLEHGSKQVYFHRLYIDEVQDFTMSELFLLFQFCDPNWAFLAGDTAQTIARGIGFRFSDLKTLFTQMNLELKGLNTIRTPNPYSLVTSYRSHMGVLKLASSVIEVLYKYFPRAIDKLGLDRGLFDGPKPKWLMVDDTQELFMMLVGSREGNEQIDFGHQQVILVRDDAARKSLPPALSQSCIVLTIFEAKGLEFNTVLLWNFFGDSPASKEWRVLYSYWEKYKEDADSKTATGGGGDGIHAESFSSMEGDEKNRPLDFEEGKYTILESELKALYCALTRARINIWIVDFDKEKRDPAYKWFVNAGLCETINKDTAMSLSMVESDENQSSHVAFQARGLHFYSMAMKNENPEGLLETAATCFRRAEAYDLLQHVSAYLSYIKAMNLYEKEMSVKSKKKVSNNTEVIMFEAAKECLISQGTEKLTMFAAKLFSKLKKHELSGLVFSSLRSLFGSKRAILEYEKASLPKQKGVELCNVLKFIQDKIASFKESALSPDEVSELTTELSRQHEQQMALTEKHFRSNGQYGEAIRLMEQSNIKPPDDLVKLQLKSLIRRFSVLISQQEKESNVIHLPAELEQALNRISVDDAVTMLLSNGGVEVAALYLTKHGRKADAADLLQRHFSYRKASLLHEELGRFADAANCEVLACLEALPVLTTFPLENISTSYSVSINITEKAKFKKQQAFLLDRLKQFQDSLKKASPWLHFTSIGLRSLLNKDLTAIQKVFLGESKLLGVGELIETPEFAFVFDRWLLLEQPLKFLGEDVVKNMFQFCLPNMLHLIEMMLKEDYSLSEEISMYYGMDITHTGDSEVAELGERFGSKVLIELCEKYGVQTVQSLARSSNLRVGKLDVIKILTIHLITAVSHFTSCVIDYSKQNDEEWDTVSGLNLGNLNAVAALLFMKDVSVLQKVWKQKYYKDGMVVHDKSKLSNAKEKSSLESMIFDTNVKLESLADSLFSTSANPWEVEKFLSNIIIPKVASALCECVKKKWMKLFVSNRKHANLPSAVVQLWSSTVLANAIEKKVNRNNQSSCFKQCLNEASFKGAELKAKKKNQYQHDTLAVGNKVISKYFHKDAGGRMVFPEEIGSIIRRDHRNIEVKFESQVELWLHDSKVIAPNTTSQDFGTFIAFLSGECEAKFIVDAPKYLMRIIKHLCFTKVDSLSSASGAATEIASKNESQAFDFSGNMSGTSDREAITHLLELAVSLILTMVAASTSPSSSPSNNIFIPNYLAMKHLKDPLNRIESSSTNETTVKKPKRAKYQSSSLNVISATSKPSASSKIKKAPGRSTTESKEQKSTFQVLRDLTQFVNGEKADLNRSKCLKSLSFMLKNIVYLLDKRLTSCLNADQSESDDRKRCSILLLTLLCNLSSCSHLFDVKYATNDINKLWWKLVQMLVDICGVPEANDWVSTYEAGQLLCSLLEEDEGLTSYFVIKKGTKLTTKYYDFDDFLSEIEDGRKSFTLLKSNKISKSNNDRAWQEEEMSRSYASAEESTDDSDAAIQQRQQQENELLEKRVAASKFLKFSASFNSALTKWQEDRKHSKGKDHIPNDLNGQETMKKLHEEHDAILATDQHVCKLCTYPLKGNTAEVHLTMLSLPYSPAPPDAATAGKIVLNGQRVRFMNYDNRMDGACILCFPSTGQSFRASLNDLRMEPCAENLNYYNSYLQYCNNEVNIVRNEVVSIETELDSLSDESERAEQLQTLLDDAKNELSRRLENMDRIWTAAASCRFHNHVLDEAHCQKTKELLLFRNNTETPILKDIVQATLLNRKVTDHIQKLNTLIQNDSEQTQNEGIKDELELQYSEVDSQIGVLKQFLKQCRQKKTFNSRTTLNMIVKYAEKLRSAIKKLEELMSRVASNTKKEVEYDNGDDELADDGYDEADQYGDAVTGDEASFQLSKKEMKKLNSKKKKESASNPSPASNMVDKKKGKGGRGSGGGGKSK